uniref:Uncharacterized protein n=1 Tax=Rhizophora mucronata TaxID=61149 RepID=A0A2P2PB16_RHIMU
MIYGSMGLLPDLSKTQLVLVNLHLMR